jgi:hypothetical protein
MRAWIIREDLSPKNPLLGDIRRHPGIVEVGGQLVPPVAIGGNLGQRPDRESSEIRVQHRGGELAGRLERKSVVDVRRDRPQLLAALDRVLASLREIQELIPFGATAQPIDHSEKTVDVGSVD